MMIIMKNHNYDAFSTSIYIIYLFIYLSIIPPHNHNNNHNLNRHTINKTANDLMNSIREQGAVIIVIIPGIAFNHLNVI